MHRKAATTPEPVEVLAPEAGDPLAPIRAWFDRREWAPFPFQEQAWRAFLNGRSGLINVPTGAGKTYAAYMGPLADVMEELKRPRVIPPAAEAELPNPLTKPKA